MNIVLSALALLLSGLFATSVHADINEYITASFNPDPANPMVNKFKNTTDISSVCSGHIKPQCEALGIFSLRNNTFRAYMASPIPVGTDPRKGAMFKVPSQWRSFDVTNPDTKEVKSVEMRIAGIGSHWRGISVGYWGRPGIPWQTQWRDAPSPCVKTGFFTADTHAANFFWVVPEGAGACVAFPGIEVPNLEYRTLEYAYELRTPNPLEMSTGDYAGSVTYTMGPMGDFDFGDNMIPQDKLITFHFALKVEHTLKVDIPPGGNRVELVPQGGWQSWLTHGRKPTRLFRDQTFNISASSRFKMLLECQSSPDGKTCWVQDPVSLHEVPLNISVSLPFGLNDANEQPVNRRPLLLDGSGTEKFQPGVYVDRKPGTLHFEIPQSEVAGMIGTGAQRKYSGNVTVIWDSEV